MRLDEDRQVDLRVSQHLQQLVTGSHGPLQVILDIGGGKDLSQRQSLSGDIVIPEGPGRIRVIEDRQPPRIRRELRPFGDEGEISVNPPSWSKISAYLRLQGGYYRLHLGIRQYRTGVNNRHFDVRHFFLRGC